MEAFIKFVLQRYHITRTGSRGMSNWSVATVVGPTSGIRAYTVFLFRTSKIKMCKFGLAPNVVIFITNLIKCVVELNHADRHDLPYVFFTFTTFRERAIQFMQCRVYVPPRRNEPLRRSKRRGTQYKSD